MSSQEMSLLGFGTADTAANQRFDVEEADGVAAKGEVLILAEPAAVPSLFSSGPAAGDHIAVGTRSLGCDA